MPYVEVPIIGTGTFKDPYRPALGRVPRSAVIPTGPNGRPLQRTCLVWVDDKHDTEIERSVKRIPAEDAKNLIRQLDSNVNPEHIGPR